MIIVLRAGATDGDVRQIEESLRSRGLTAHISRGVERTIIGAIGDERKLDPEAFEGLPAVEKVLRILAPFKLVSREFRKEDTVIEVNGRSVGGTCADAPSRVGDSRSWNPPELRALAHSSKTTYCTGPTVRKAAPMNEGSPTLSCA